MDLFDIQAIDFKWVALFILLYIVLAGPVEFLILRYVFKRMELTWITFPSMVLGISILAYFAAYALKGQDLRINKVDIVDFDLRTELNDLRKTRKAFASGTSFFTILSPQIKSYTIGLEANPAFWQASSKDPLSADMITWAGRPDGDAWAMRRGGGGGGGGLFRMPYHYVRDGSGLEGVPIPVWTSKSVLAKWETPLNKLPFQADLRYFGDRSQKIRGQIVNHLAVDLVDAWLIYSDNCYSIQGGLPSAKNQADAKELALGDRALRFNGWLSEADECDQKRPTFPTGFYNPTTSVKQICFLQRLDTTSMLGNHSLRSLDWGWRVQEERGLLNDTTTREAILFARVRPSSADLTTLEQETHPTKVWLDNLPTPGNVRTPLVGQGNQDTYIRVVFPVLPSEK